MCNCLELPAALADLDYWERNFDFQGAQTFEQFFAIEKLDTESFTPPLVLYERFYRCAVCGQNWFVELSLEEDAFPIFAFKFGGALPVAKETIAGKKQFLSILAHGGFEAEKCVKNGCPNFRLNKRALCHLHIPFP